MRELGPYLQQAMREPWGWGAKPGIDCCKLGARWVVACGHEDPMLFLHPLYDSERAALLTIRRGDGLVALWTIGMANAGVPEVDEPQSGDVGVLEVETDDGLGQAVGIYTGERWAVRQQAGMHFGPATPLRVWRP